MSSSTDPRPDSPAITDERPRHAVPAGHGFAPALRLRKQREFKAVFADNRRSSDALLTLLARPSTLDHARLGLAVSRKTSRHAVERNRLKRIIREDFRQRRPGLPPLDVVAITRPAAAGKSAGEIRHSLQRHWRRIVAQCAS